MEQFITIPIPETTITIPEPLPEATLAWTIQFVEWQEVFDGDAYPRVGLEYRDYEIYLDDQPANGWTITQYADENDAWDFDDAEGMFWGRFGEDAEFKFEHLRVLVDHLQAIGYRGCEKVWKGKQILLENVEMRQRQHGPNSE